MDNSISTIHDSRDKVQLAGLSVSGYKLGKVRLALRKALKSGEIEPACYWGGELLCSYRAEDYWEEIISFYSKHINVASPNLAIYLSERTRNFKAIATALDERELRNDYDVRRIFAEVTTVVILSRRRAILRTPPKFQLTALEMTSISPLLRADSSSLAYKYLSKGDPTDIHIPLNELGFHLSFDKGDANLACYWIDWLLYYISEMRKQKRQLRIEKRLWPAVQDKYKDNPIWAVWDCLKGTSKQLENSKVERIVEALSNVFCLRFTDSSPTRRRHIMYTAVHFIIDEPRQYPALCRDMERVTKVKDRIDLIYSQISTSIDVTKS